MTIKPIPFPKTRHERNNEGKILLFYYKNLLLLLQKYSRSSAIFGFYREDQVSQLGERCNVRRLITWPGSRFLMHDPFLATAPTAEASRPWRNSFSMKRFTDEPYLWHNTSSKIDECADSAPKGWVFSKRIGVFGDSIRLESILDLFFPWPGIHCLSRTAVLSYYRVSSSRLPRFLREPHPWHQLIRIRWQPNRLYRSSNHADFCILRIQCFSSIPGKIFSHPTPISVIRYSSRVESITSDRADKSINLRPSSSYQFTWLDRI